MKRLLLLAGLMAMVGCATRPLTLDQTRDVPQSLFPIQADGGTVIIKRDSGLMGGMCRIAVFVDGKQAAKIGPHERVALGLPPGQHVIGAEPVGICGGGLVETSVTVEKGRTFIFRLSFDGSGGFKIQPTAT